MSPRTPKRLAWDKFKHGQRVKMSDEYLTTGPKRWVPRQGIVVGFGYNGTSVFVRKDGQVSKASYHMDFWEPYEQTSDATLS